MQRINRINNLSSYIFNLLIQTLLILIKIQSIITDCPRETPIYTSNACGLKYCQQSDFLSGKCTIKNEIVKKQWLNNIIVIGDIYFRYINFGLYENGDLVIATTQFPGTITRIFYGIKYNGRPLFTENNNETSHLYINITEDDIGNLEGVSQVIKTSTDGKEYFLYISKLENFAEMFDLENGNVYKAFVYEFCGVADVESLRHTFIPITNIDNNNYYYYIFGFVGILYEYDGIKKYIFFRKYLFTISSYSFYQYDELIYKGDGFGYGFMVSCFETKNYLIICFYMTKKPEINYMTMTSEDKIYLNLIKFSNDLNQMNEKKESFQITLDDEYMFFKGVFLKEDVGVFAYFDYESTSIQPKLLFKEFNNNQFINYLPDEIPSSLIILNLPGLSHNLLLNDLIRINENKVCFSSTLSDKETIYIVLINISDDKKIKIRYYSIPTFKLYNYKLLFELRVQTYKNFIAFSSSFCPNETCSSDDDEHYCSLIIFSYPNGTDYKLDVEKYLFDNNNASINDFKIDLKEHIVIENNIFGYIYGAI